VVKTSPQPLRQEPQVEFYKTQNRELLENCSDRKMKIHVACQANEWTQGARLDRHYTPISGELPGFPRHFESVLGIEAKGKNQG